MKTSQVSNYTLSSRDKPPVARKTSRGLGLPHTSSLLRGAYGSLEASQPLPDVLPGSIHVKGAPKAMRRPSARPGIMAEGPSPG